MDKYNNYIQYQFSLPSRDLEPDFVGDLARELELPYDIDDFEEQWFNRDEDHAYLIRDAKVDPDTFILIQLLADGEFDSIVVRFKKEYTAQVKSKILSLWKYGHMAKIAAGTLTPDFSNKLHDAKFNWVPKIMSDYQLDMRGIMELSGSTEEKYTEQ
ncbi:hypothetical protein [Laceyella putida]|jgi:hypothetical protein|uniref:Uncharacterized protein n=1 Tax=Laceyella putida TaxID=110101 RepID=A0ABW2RK68_9BACL